MPLHTRSEEALSQIRQKVGQKNGKSKKVVFVSGNFNIVHPGHLRLLTFAHECGQFLVVGVNQDSDAVVIPGELRLDSVRSLGMVNYAFLLEDTPEDFIAALKPDVVVKGKEHEGQFNAEQKAVDTYGGKLLFSSGDARFSSIDLLQREFKETNLSTIQKPTDFLKRHSFSFTDIHATLNQFKGLRVSVVGDLIVDEYITCEPLGLSQEDPTIVVTPVTTNRFIGGASIIAAHAKGLGAKVRYFSVCGKDEPAEFARTLLDEYGVTSQLFEDENRPTTLKQRFRASGKTLLRVSHLKQHDVPKDLGNRIIRAVKDSLSETDLLIYSDFNYGCLPQYVVDKISDLCAKRDITIVADSQSSSQVGDVSRFKNSLLLTPTEREARLATRDFNSGLVVLAENLRKQARAKNVVITLGAEGLLIHAPATEKGDWVTDRLPAFNTAPKDTAGAGDSFLTCCSMALTVGSDIWQATYLGCLAAACQVGRVGNIPLSSQDILSEIQFEAGVLRR